MKAREPSTAKRMLRMPLSADENEILIQEIMKSKKKISVNAFATECVEKGVDEMQKEMDSNSCIVFTVDQPVITEEIYNAHLYIPISIYERLKNLADYTGYNVMRLAKYMLLKDLKGRE